MSFVKATKKASKARISLIGVSGSGKTYTALSLADGLKGNGRVAVIDTERGSASKYSGVFDFDVMELESFHPQQYINGIQEAQSAGYAVLVIDSLSHAWMGKDGALELVDNAQKKQQGGNSFTAWKSVTPLHNALIDAIVQARMHVIVTMRAKTEYIVETNERGKQAPRKVGLAPVQRDGMEYEFDIVGTLSQDNDLVIDKTRCPELNGKVYNKAGADVAAIIRRWLDDGVPVADLEPKRNELRQQIAQEKAETGAWGGKSTPELKALSTIVDLDAEIDASKVRIAAAVRDAVV